MTCGRAVLAVGTKLNPLMTAWGIDNKLAGRARRCRQGRARLRYCKPKVALIGDAAPILRKLIDAELAKRTATSAPRAATR